MIVASALVDALGEDGTDVAALGALVRHAAGCNGSLIAARVIVDTP